MYVEKIEVPAFRVLRDVVLDFAGGYDPQIFPLGSKNGGGKSTLLQLVFVLLHCNQREHRKYLRNIVGTDTYPGNDPKRTIARFTVRLGESTHVLEFLSLNDEFLTDKLSGPLEYGFGTASAQNLLRRKSTTAEKASDSIKQEQAALTADFERIRNLMLALDYRYIIAYERRTPEGERWHALVCHVHGRSKDETLEILEAIGGKIFLLGPSNQQYLFLNKNAREAVLNPRVTEGDPDQYDRDNPPPDAPNIKYMKAVSDAESDMPGFYAYDWLSVEPLLRLFMQAKDEDFKAMVKIGAYGNRYKTILTEVNDLLPTKKVRPLPDLSGIEFLIEDARGNQTPLHPADLSQGELKRLLMFAWLRANNATDALVLIDEIESSFHPDWQVGIVRDLQDWGPQNQYILATHSYELCQALTPRHVKELEPRLAEQDVATKESHNHGIANG